MTLSLCYSLCAITEYDYIKHLYYYDGVHCNFALWIDDIWSEFQCSSIDKNAHGIHLSAAQEMHKMSNIQEPSNWVFWWIFSVIEYDSQYKFIS